MVGAVFTKKSCFYVSFCTVILGLILVVLGGIRNSFFLCNQFGTDSGVQMEMHRTNVNLQPRIDGAVRLFGAISDAFKQATQAHSCRDYFTRTDPVNRTLLCV